MVDQPEPSPALNQVAEISSKPQTGAIGTGLAGPFQLHVLGLFFVLLAIFPFVIGDTVWSADIGARLYQAKHLLDTDVWSVPHPLPRADPDGQLFPLHLSATTKNPFQYVVFPKHPALVWMTAGVFRYGGLRGLVLVQTLSTLAAAVGTARLVARTRPSHAVGALWFTGLLSPLFFDAYLGYSHSLAAALLVWGAVLTLQFADPRPAGNRADGIFIVGASLLVALACLVRTEAVLAGIALSVGVMVAGFGHWNRARWFVAFLAIGSSTTAAAVLDRIMTPSYTGFIGAANDDSWGGLAGRIEGLQRTWLSPGRRPADTIILLAAIMVIAGGYLATRQLAKPITATLAVALALAMTRAVMTESVLVYGLVAACPLLILGLIRGVPLARTNYETRLFSVTFALYSLAVLATQYRFGGVAEWGGRYFAAGIPFAVAVAVPGLGRVVSVFDRAQARRVVFLAASVGLVVNLAGLWGLRQSRLSTEAMVDEIAASMSEVYQLNLDAPSENGLAYIAVDDSRPIVVTTVPAAARLSWNIVNDGAWLLVDEDELEDVAQRLRELKVKHFALFTTRANEELAEIANHYKVESWVKSEHAPGDVIILSTVD